MVVKNLDLSKNIEEILSDLIRINSVSGNEKEITDVIELAITKLGIDLSVKRINNTLVYSLDLSKSETIALVGHTDTVPIKDNGEPRLEEDNIYGRGACDMKAGIASMLKLLYDIKEGNVSPKYNMRFVFYESEEEYTKPNIGMERIIDDGLLKDVDFAFVLEPTDGEYGVGCLGSIMARKEFKGKAAHSSTPWKGENAIYKSREFIEKIESIAPKKYVIDGMEHYEVIELTKIVSPNAENVIPDSVIASINYRYSPSKTEEEARKELLDIIGKENVTLHSSPSGISDGNDDYLKKDKKRFIMQGWTDIARLNNAGIPAINFGPGNMDYAHQEDEHIAIRDLKAFYEGLVNHLKE